MNASALPLPSNLQSTTDRFVAACHADGRVVAAFLHGSYARGTADVYSDLDLGLVTTDESYDEFCAGRDAFVRQFGTPLFLESFARPHYAFFVFANGTEGELALTRTRDIQQVTRGPFRVLLDKTGVLTGTVLSGYTPTPTEQQEVVRRLMTWFWHDLSHFITAMGRGHLWWAYGQLEELRRYCVNLARLRHDDAEAAEAYEKVDQALPVAELSPLETTYCSLEHGAMLAAGLVIVRYYQDVAPVLARTYTIPYPDELERLMLDRLDLVCGAYGIRLHHDADGHPGV